MVLTSAFSCGKQNRWFSMAKNVASRIQMNYAAQQIIKPLTIQHIDFFGFLTDKQWRLKFIWLASNY